MLGAGCWCWGAGVLGAGVLGAGVLGAGVLGCWVLGVLGCGAGCLEKNEGALGDQWSFLSLGDV